MLRIIAWYHIIQAGLAFLTLALYGYSYRLDYEGLQVSESPILANLFLSIGLLVISYISREKTLTIIPSRNANIFIIIWFLALIIKVCYGSIFISDAIYNYLMPVLVYTQYLLKNRKIVAHVILWISFIYFSLLGARGYAILPIVFAQGPYLLSRFFQFSLIKKLFTTFVLIGLIGVYMNSVEFYRIAFGRDKIDLKGITQVISNVSEYQNAAIEYVGVKRAPWDRAINHPMSAMMDYKGELRGFKQFEGDVKLVYDRSASNYLNTEFGHWTSTHYGFFASGSTSVEWSIVSDFISRFGRYRGLILSYISYIFLGLLINLLSSKYAMVNFVIKVHILMNFFVYNLFENVHILFKAWAFLFAVYILTNAFFNNRNISKG